MTSSSDESAQSEDLGISDDQLPEDLQAEGNPLAGGLEPGESAGDLLEEGKSAEQDSVEDSGEKDSGSDNSGSET
jgi:hypothetical protein